MIPKIGLLVCGSNASNTGGVTAQAALETIKEREEAGILSLPALANAVERQIALAKKVSHVMVVDGCKNACARKIAENMGIEYDAYVNLEYDLKIKKKGPFTTTQYTSEDVIKAKNEIQEGIKEILTAEKRDHER
jgi:uncharacterized metal-binding protein